MGNYFDKETAASLFQKLREEYDVFAPKLFPGDGCFSDTDTVRYGILNSFDEIVWNQKSDYSFKETLLPVSETIMYFTENSTRLPEPKKKRLIFLRSCEIHALKRLDEIYLRNGFEDSYYKNVRENAKFVLMGCESSFPSCFCVSMGTNQTDFCDAYAHPEEDGLYLEFEDPDLKKTAHGLFSSDRVYARKFVTENEASVRPPEHLPEDIAQNDLWREYSGRCIGCGRCNFVCPTCTCFTMQDIFYRDNENAGERRRVWASCQVDGYSDIAGGISFRKDQGERMRFKVLHKIYHYKNRFGYHMCVGCGRCENICPEYISYIRCLHKLSKIGGPEDDQ